MAISVTNKSLIAGISSIAIGGAIYGTHSFLNSTQSIKEVLIKKLKTPLDLNATQGEDFELLKELTKQYHNKKPTGKADIEGFKLSSESDVEGLKRKCLELFEINNKNENFQAKLTQAEEWCTKENAPRKISSLLPAGKSLLTSGDGNKWDQPWAKFKEDYKNQDPQGPWSISTWSTIKTNSAVEEAFKQKCTTNGALSIIPNKEKDLLDKILKYCTKDNG